MSKLSVNRSVISAGRHLSIFSQIPTYAYVECVGVLMCILQTRQIHIFIHHSKNVHHLVACSLCTRCTRSAAKYYMFQILSIESVCCIGNTFSFYFYPFGKSLAIINFTTQHSLLHFCWFLVFSGFLLIYTHILHYNYRVSNIIYNINESSSG